MQAISPELRAELDQTSAWWTREYDTLVRKCFPPKPFDPLEHEGHDLIEIRAYGSATVRTFCTQCRP